MTEVSDFEFDKEELGNSLNESDEEVSDLESCSSTDKDEPSPSAPQSNSISSQAIMFDLQISRHPHGYVLAT